MGEFFYFGRIQALSVLGPKCDSDLLILLAGVPRLKFRNYFLKEKIVPDFKRMSKKKLMKETSEDSNSLLAGSEVSSIGLRKEVRRPSKSDINPAHRRSWHEEKQSVDVVDGPFTRPTTFKPQHKRSQSDVPVNMLTRSTQNTTATSLSFSEQTKLKRNLIGDPSRKRSLLEDGCCSLVAKTECFFPQPEEGQSLTSFLSSKDFHTCAELDKENAHFYISEALISAVEQIKCNQSLHKAQEENDDESDEEIQHLKQRIRIRRRERQQEKAKQSRHVHLLSDGKTDTTTSQSPSSPPSSSCSSRSRTVSSSESEDVNELEFSDTTESVLSSIRDKGLSLSMASLYSDADIKRFEMTLPDQSLHFSQSYLDGSCGVVSAEAVALCLLKKFSEKQLPKASELEWLVSEQEAPQTLLPLPDSWPISPDDVEEQTSSQRTRLRGTFDWAPPRAQIIFNIQLEPSKKIQAVAKQKFRCAGCAMRIDKGYIQRFRYCKYLGKYFCQCCHSGSRAVIPAHVIHKWDFTRYPVSNFSRDLLDRISEDPLFNIHDLNLVLYRHCKNLERVRYFRLQLSFIRDYITTCSLSNQLKKSIESLPSHWLSEIDLYSMQDLMQVKVNKMREDLRQLTEMCTSHILKCPLCSSKGFICEVCHSSKTVIFPFQLNKVIRCKDCGTCSHKECYIPQNPCPKCRRIKIRREKLKEKVFSSDEET